MGVFDALSRLFSGSTTIDPGERPELHDLAAQARGETVTAAVLANQSDRSNDEIFEYLATDEQPQYVFLGNQVVIDNDDSYTTEYPTRQTQLVITDRRLLIVLGNAISDTVWEVPLCDVLGVYLDDESWQRYLVVEADREGEQMTFFVDVTMESQVDELSAGVEFVRNHAA